MMKTLKIIALISVLSVVLSLKVYSQGQIERSFTGTSYLETRQDFIYRYKYIPVLDATYHEFSSDQITWHKLYVAGDCYVRFTNKTDNSANPHGEASGYHPSTSWWILNICALDSTDEVSGIDTLYIDYGTEIDTLFPGEFTIKFNLPDTVSGTSTNYQDSLTHTHLLQIYINDNLDVDAYPTDGQVLKWNEITGQWIAAPDLIGGGGGSLKVTEEDNSPSVTAVTEIRVPNSHLINNGNGSVSLILSLSPIPGANDYWRTGIDTTSAAGTHSVAFSSPLPSDDYVVAAVYGIYPNSMRQNLVYGNQTASGFDAYGVMDSLVQIHYLAIRNVDSLLAVMAEIGKVLSNPLDTVYGYLSNKVDDSTIVVRNNQLHVFNSPSADSLNHIAASEYALIDSLELVDLIDVDTTGIKTGQILVYDSIFKTNYNIIDTTATVSFRKSYVDTLTADSATVDQLRITVGAGAGKVLVSDADGDATWTDLFSYGEIHDTTFTVATGVIGTYYTMKTLQIGLSSGVTLTDSTLTIGATGIYKLNFSSSFTHDINNTTVHMSAFVDDVEFQNVEAERKIGTGGDVGNISGTGLLSLTAGQVIKIKGRADNIGTITVNHMNINITRIK